MEYDWLEGQLEQPNLSDYSGHYASQIPDGVFTRKLVSDGRHGSPGYHGQPGSNGFGFGGYGQPGARGGHGEHGRPAQPLELSILGVDHTFHIVGESVIGNFAMPLSSGDANHLILSAVGGNGGLGGAGERYPGRGGNGATGMHGRNATRCSNGTNGGPGGNGGTGGMGGGGGDGGQGGTIQVTVDQRDLDTLMILKQFNPQVYGGKPGQGGFGGDGGSGGSGGRGGSSYTYSTGSGDNRRTHTNPGGCSGPNGRRGYHGESGAIGMQGMDGSVLFSIKKSGGGVDQFSRLFDLMITKANFRDSLGYGLYEPGCKIHSLLIIQNIGDMYTPSHQDTHLYIDNDNWVVSERPKLPRQVKGGDSVHQLFDFDVLQHVRKPSIGAPHQLAITLDYRACVSRVTQEYCRIEKTKSPLTLSYPVELSNVERGASITLGEESPFCFQVVNKSNRPIGVEAQGEYSRKVNVGLAISFGPCSRNVKKFLSPHEIEIRDHSGKLFETVNGLFHDIGILQPREEKYVCGTIKFLNPNIPPLTSLELAGNLMLGRLDNRGDPTPLQIMPFQIQISAYYQFDPEATFLLVVNHRTTVAEKDAWNALIGSIGGKMNTWNISLHGDLCFAEDRNGRSLLKDFACQTIIILNNAIHDDTGAPDAFHLVRVEELLEAARDYGISLFVVGRTVDFQQQLEPKQKMVRDVVHYSSLGKYKKSMMKGHILGGAHPYPASLSSDLCGNFKSGRQRFWLSLFASDKVLACYNSPSDEHPEKMFILEGAVLYRLPNNSFSLRATGVFGQFQMTRVEKYKHRVNYCSSFEVWMGRFREIEGLEIRDGEREQEEEERGEEDEDYEEEGGSLLSEQVVFGWLEKKGTFGYDKRFFILRQGTKQLEYHLNEQKPVAPPRCIFHVHHQRSLQDLLIFKATLKGSKSFSIDFQLPRNGTFTHLIGEFLKFEMVRNTLSGDPLLPFEMVEGVEQGMLIDGMEALLDRFKAEVDIQLQTPPRIKQFGHGGKVSKSSSSSLSLFGDSEKKNDENMENIFLHQFSFSVPVEELMEQDSKKFCIITPERKYHLKAVSVADKRRWISALEKLETSTFASTVEKELDSSKERNYIMKDIYRTSLSSTKSVQQSFEAAEKFFRRGDQVARIPIEKTYILSDPSPNDDLKCAREILEELHEKCPNQRLFGVVEAEQMKISKFTYRLGYLEIHRSLDKNMTHFVGLSVPTKTMHDPLFISSENLYFNLLKSIDFFQKLMTLERFERLETEPERREQEILGGREEEEKSSSSSSSFPFSSSSFSSSSSSSFPPPSDTPVSFHSILGESSLKGALLSAILSDIAVDIECYVSAGKLDLSSLNSQLVTLRALSDFKFEDPTSQTLREWVMEVLFHCKKMIKKVDVSQRFALKRPFARRALSNSLEKVARRCLRVSEGWFEKMMKKIKEESPGVELSIDLYKRPVKFQTYQAYFDTSLSFSPVQRKEDYQQGLRLRRPPHFQEQKYFIHDEARRSELLLRQQQTISSHATVVSRLGLEPYTEPSLQRCLMEMDEIPFVENVGNEEGFDGDGGEDEDDDAAIFAKFAFEEDKKEDFGTEQRGEWGGIELI